MTATRLTNSGTSSSPGGNYYDITASPYNASTGATDNSAAINAAIVDARANSGIVYVPPGTFKYATQLDFAPGGLLWTGGGIVGIGRGSGEVNQPRSQLRYTGTASPAIKMYSIAAFGVEGINFTYDNPGFTGDLIAIDGFPLHSDATNWMIRGCGSLHKGAAVTARSIIRVENAINGKIENCGFGGAANCIRLADPNGNYVVGVSVENCTFNASTDAHILIGSNDSENCIIRNNRFEAGINTGAVRGTTIALDGGDNNCYSLQINDNWCGDASGTVSWLKGLRGVSNSQIVVNGNYFAANGSGTHVDCDLVQGITLVMIGNKFDSGANIFSCNPTSRVTMIGNFVNAPANLCNGGGDRPTQFVVLGNTTGGATIANAASDTLSTRVAFGCGKSGGAFAGGNFDVGLTGQQEQLVLGAISGTGRQAMGDKAAVYTTVGGAGSTPHCLNLQAPTDDIDRKVALVAGTTPTERVTASGVGIAFNGAVPVATPARVGQLTDSTGGSVTTTLAAGITDAVAKNAIASLAAKVNALETIIHNYGLST